MNPRNRCRECRQILHDNFVASRDPETGRIHRVCWRCQNDARDWMEANISKPRDPSPKGPIHVHA